MAIYCSKGQNITIENESHGELHHFLYAFSSTGERKPHTHTHTRTALVCESNTVISHPLNQAAGKATDFLSAQSDAHLATDAT